MNALASLQEAVFDAIWRADSQSDLAYLDRNFRRAVSVHRGTCHGALQAALSIAYPATRDALGAVDFTRLAAAYAAEHPPTSAWLEEYGGGFPEFLERWHGAEAAGIGRIDLAVNLALHADARHDMHAGVRPLSELAHVSEAMLKKVRLVPHPASRLVRVSAAAANAWREFALGERWPEPAGATDSVHLLVYRSADGVAVERVDGDLASLLTQLQRGSLGDAFRCHRDAVDRYLARLFQQSVFAAWITTNLAQAQGEPCP